MDTLDVDLAPTGVVHHNSYCTHAGLFNIGINA